MNKEEIYNQCSGALDTCKALDIALVGIQSRLELDMPVDATMKIVEANLRTLNERIEDLINHEL